MRKHSRPEKTYIYLLRCPIDGSPKYVGKSNDPNKRKDGHKSKSKTKDNPLSKWIKQLNDKNLKPIVEIIEEVDYKEWIEKEKFYIKKYRDEGFDLKNLNNGSNGLSGPNQTSFKKGNKSWNEGTGNSHKRKCDVCGKIFFGSLSKVKRQQTCSKICGGLLAFNKQKEARNIERIVQLDLEMNFLEIFESQSDIERKTGFKRATIRARIIKNSLAPHGGYIWMSESQYEKIKNESNFK